LQSSENITSSENDEQEKIS
jgi:hypothetical protein